MKLQAYLLACINCSNETLSELDFYVLIQMKTEMLVYEHFAGNNSCLKFIIRYKRKEVYSFTSFCIFLVGTLKYFF